MNSKKLQLQPRLQMLAEMVPYHANLADIGTDHGYLPVWLLQENRISKVIASDINREPLEHARRTAEEYGLEDRIGFRLCSGLNGFKPGEVDTIVIAGMGGETIIAILQEAPWTRAQGMTLILQPMTKAETLRIWLADNGYTFTEERLVKDKEFLYPIFSVTGGERDGLTPEEAFGGVLLEGDPLYAEYLERQIARILNRIKGLERSERKDSGEEIEGLKSLYHVLLERKDGAG